MSWRALHLFLADAARADAFLAEVVAPALADCRLRGLAGHWFFLRYWEGGPHLRLRVRDMPEADFARLATHLRLRLPHYLPLQRQLPGAYPDDMVFERPDVDAEARRWLPQGTVMASPYVPETLRYGGAQALGASERLFCRSSTLALQVIGEAGSKAARQSCGLLLTCVALAVATRDQAGLLDFLARMQRTWGAILGETRVQDATASASASARCRGYLDLIRHLQAGGAAPGGHALAWYGALRDALCDRRALAERGALACPETGAVVADAASFERAVAALVDAHVHMMNNRLGLTPAVEYWFASLITDAAHAAPPTPPTLDAAARCAPT